MKNLKGGEYRIPNDANAILGAGNFGKVYKGYDRSNQLVAIKEIPKSKLEEHPYIAEAFQSELSTQKKATATKLPYFVELRDNFSTEDYEYVVLEFCDGGTLTDYYKKNKLTIDQILEIIYQVSIGVEYLHRIGITHRDLKLDNILKHGKHYKIADFGFATEKSVLATCLGTGYYMSPELVKEEEYDRRVDVWAVNTMLYKMLTKRYYFDGRSRNQLDNNIINQKFRVSSSYRDWPENLKDLLKRGYEKNFRRRPTMMQYMEHPVFNHLRKGHEQNVAMVSNIKFKKKKTTGSTQQNNQPQTVDKSEQYYQEVQSKIVNLINNLKLYFDLYLRMKGIDLVLATALIKRYIQQISYVNIFFHNQRYSPVDCFKHSGISQEHWSAFYGRKDSRRFVLRLYHHLFISIREYKASWEVIENQARSSRTPNPVKLEISQPIRNSLVNSLETIKRTLEQRTDPQSFQAKQLVQEILKFETNQSLLFLSAKY